MQALDKSAILAASKLRLDTLEVPEWGGVVYVRVMTGYQRDRWECLQQANPNENIRARLAVFVLCDAEGKPLFTERDIPELSQGDSLALDRIWEHGVKVNRLGKEELEQLAGNSPGTPSDSSV